MSPLVSLLLHFSNILFLGCFNLFPGFVNGLTVMAYIILVRKDFSFQRGAPMPSLRLFIFSFAALLFIKFGSILTNGIHTVPNWDYYKYNYLLDGIYQSFPEPALILKKPIILISKTTRQLFSALQSSNVTTELAYYYAIFLPGVLFSKILALLSVSVNVFILQTLFNLWFVVMASVLIASLSLTSGVRTAVTFFIFLFLVGGWDGAHWLLNPNEFGGGLFRDIQHGGTRAFFQPIRIQDFTSYAHWLPGHLMSALGALVGVIMLEKGHFAANKTFFSLALPLFLLSTSIFAFFSYCFYLFLNITEEKITEGENREKGMAEERRGIISGEILLFLGVILMMAAFYGLGKKSGGMGLFIDFKLFSYGLRRWILIFFQEFLPFIAIAFVLNIKSRHYYLSIAFMVFLCIVGSRDLIMSASILPLLYLIYQIALAFDFKSKRAWIGMTVIMLIYSPSQFANLGDILDLEQNYSNGMSPDEMRGADNKLIQACMLVYTREPH